jgi:hypothetical protein
LWLLLDLTRAVLLVALLVHLLLLLLLQSWHRTFRHCCCIKLHIS